MKEILIIGYGDIATRFSNIMSNDDYKIHGISRNNTHDTQNFISWNWLSDATPQLESDEYDSIIFIPNFFK